MIKNDKLLIHFLYESLSDVNLNGNKIKKWRDLTKEFMCQYKLNIEMAQSQSNLRSMMKRNNEFIKEYNQKWHEMAAQIHPSLLKKLISIFICTFKSPYFEYLIGNSSAYFIDIVTTTEKIDHSLKLEKIRN